MADARSNPRGSSDIYDAIVELRERVTRLETQVETLASQVEQIQRLAETIAVLKERLDNIDEKLDTMNMEFNSLCNCANKVSKITTRLIILFLSFIAALLGVQWVHP